MFARYSKVVIAAEDYEQINGRMLRRDRAGETFSWGVAELSCGSTYMSRLQRLLIRVARLAGLDTQDVNTAFFLNKKNTTHAISDETFLLSDGKTVLATHSETAGASRTQLVPV